MEIDINRSGYLIQSKHNYLTLTFVDGGIEVSMDFVPQEAQILKEFLNGIIER